MTKSRVRSAPISSLLAILLVGGCAGGAEVSRISPEPSLSPRWRAAPMRLLVLNGQEDYDNRYLSTVVVDGPGQIGPCSGVIIHPRLVLTAAHCVCPSRGKSLIGFELSKTEPDINDEVKLSHYDLHGWVEGALPEEF